MNFGVDELRDAIGESNPELFAPVEEDADTMFCCPTPGCAHRQRARRRLLSVSASEPRFGQPPFTGLNIGVDGGHANGGGPILRCPKCQLVLTPKGPDKWSMVPSNTLTPGTAHSKNVYDGQVNSFQTQPATNASAYGGGEPKEDFDKTTQNIVAFFSWWFYPTPRGV